MKTVNKRKNAIKTVFSCLVLALLLWGSLNGLSLAQDELMVVRLGLKNPDGKYLFNPAQPDDDPIMLVVTIDNVSGESLLASKGYADNLNLLLRFKDPDGFDVTAQNLLLSTSGRTLPVFPDEENEVNVPGEPVEKVVAAGVTPEPGDKPYPFSVEFNIRGLYLFPRADRYTGKEFVPVGLYYNEPYILVPGTTDFARFDERIFGEDLISNGVTITLIDDADSDGFCALAQHPGLCPDNPEPDCDDTRADINPGRTEIANNGLDDDCNPATPDVVGAVTGTIENRAVMYTVAEASPLSAVPNSIEELPVRVYDISDGSCAHGIGTDWQNYESIWKRCEPQPYGAGLTNADGIAEIKIVAGVYFVIARYQPDIGQDPIYIGVSADDVEANQTITRYLTLIKFIEGDQEIMMPGKCRVVKGSELLIIQPEFVKWEDDSVGYQESYPFVFDAEGTWDVTTEIDPPKGFKVDGEDSLTMHVENGIQAVQFKIEKIKGKTQWVPTHVKYTLEHNNKTTKRGSIIHVILLK